MEGYRRTEAQDEICVAAMEALGRAVLITDCHGIILYVNRAFTTITGFSPAEVLGRTTAMLRSERQTPAFYRQMWSAIEHDGDWEGTLWNRRKDGRIYHERLNIRRMVMPDGRVRYVGVFSDISDEDALQRALIDAQKRELMVALTGGIAHNFNNYLAAIHGLAHLGGRRTGEHKSAHYFSEILATTETASTLVREMLQISHADSSLDAVFDLATTMRHATHTSRSLLPERIALVADLPETQACMVMGSPLDIEQTVLNLVANARDALEERHDAQIRVGMQRMAAQTCPTHCPHLTSCGMHRSRHATIRIEDNGPGIPEHVRLKMFDPFFTTKGCRGTGLGLASAHHIISRMDGAIWLDGRSMAGTAFQLCLPLATGANREAMA